MMLLDVLREFVWAPVLPESLDGKPLATKISELFWEFPYDRLPENRLVALSLRPEVVLICAILYLVSKPPLKALAKAVGFDGKSEVFRMAIAVHNASLAAFSAVVMFHSWSIVGNHLMEYGVESTYCDQDGSLWASGHGAWSTIFYLSKYWEFVDTWILVLKGKTASFLQVYHHTGIVVIMWGGVASQSSWLWWVVLLNSFIHTIMYTYFLIKTIYPKIEIKSAKYLTQAQIGQFFIGIFGTLGILLMGSRCASQASRMSLAILQLYVMGLVGLFLAFAAKKYKKK
mmetsp:Transcript_19788/g.46030  ORF Transcript_19788/g.46030 Transcript_19788/m.46030 type:complete len:286 (+) Transcript_19788:196-1053(+)